MKELKKYLIDGEEVSQEEFEERIEEELKNEIEKSIDGWIDSFEEEVEVCRRCLLASKVLKECLPSVYNEYKLDYEAYLSQEIEDRFSMGCYVRLNNYDFEIKEIEEEEEAEDDRSEMPWDYGKHFD